MTGRNAFIGLVILLQFAWLTAGCNKQPVSDATLNIPLIISGKEPKPDLGAEPVITIAEPKAGSIFEIGEDISYVITVSTPASGRIPEVVIAEIRQKNKIAGSNTTHLKEKASDGSLVLTATVRAPLAPGKYVARAEGIQTIVTKPETPTKNMEFETKRVGSKPVDVIIVKEKKRAKQ